MIFFKIIPGVLAACFFTVLLIHQFSLPDIAAPYTDISSTEIHVDPAIMERQTFNACGPYAVRASIHIVTGKYIPAEQINKEMPLRFSNKMTLPEGLSLILAHYGLSSSPHWKIFSSNEQRLDKLKTLIAMKHPVILLVKDYKVQHYITVVGFHEEFFSVYDSMMPLLNKNSRITVDGNGEYSGNRDIHKDELLKIWKGGGMSGFYKYWCLEVFK